MPSRRWLAASAVIAWACGASVAVAQPGKAPGKGEIAQEKREAAEEKREGAEEKREAAQERREEAQGRGEAAREKREELKAKAEELRAQATEERERAKALREKLAQGELTEEEQKELDAIKEGSRERHRARIERYERMRAPEMIKQRRRAARRAVLNRWKNHDFEKPAVHNALELHAKRMARLKRAEHLATIHDRPELLSTVRSLMQKELARHNKHMQTLTEKGN